MLEIIEKLPVNQDFVGWAILQTGVDEGNTISEVLDYVL